MDVAELIDTSVMKFIASPPDERTDLEAFLQHNQTSARNVRSLSRTLMASDGKCRLLRVLFPPSYQIQV
jgi:hypothetical protein